MTPRAVVLARGLGRRMQEADRSAALTPEQRRAADAGLKAMMPVRGRPFLDYVLSSLADAGIGQVALVVAPDHQAVRQYYADRPPARVRVDFVVQEQPLGTANALLAVESWCAGSPFLAMNADNLYPPAALAALAALDAPGLPVFARDELVRSSNIPADRVRAFALVEVDAAGRLLRIVEKPDPAHVAAAGSAALVSMNCWRFDSRIFDACRAVPRSARGEYELPEAVGVAVAGGVRFETFPAVGPVLDLSRRADAAELERRLAATTPRP
jgi:glucose-1-phosphate thymidylyltransferase